MNLSLSLGIYLLKINLFVFFAFKFLVAKSCFVVRCKQHLLLMLFKCVRVFGHVPVLG